MSLWVYRRLTGTLKRIIPKFEGRKPDEVSEDNVANCIKGGNIDTIDNTIGKTIPSVPNESIRNDQERVFGLTTQQINVKDHKDFEQITTSFETVTPTQQHKNTSIH